MACGRLLADTRLDAARFHAAVLALTTDDFAAAGRRLGALMGPHVRLLAPLCGSPEPWPAVTADIIRRPGPWHLVRDPERPCLGDAVVLVGAILQRRTLPGDYVRWLAEAREAGAVWPDERMPEIDLACGEHRAGRLRTAQVLVQRELQAEPEAPPERRAALLHLSSLNESQLGRWRPAHEQAREALALVRASGLEWELGKHLLSLGILDIRCGRLADAEARLRESVAAMLAVGRLGWSGQVRANLAVALYKVGRCDDALAELEVADSCFRDYPDLIQSSVICKLARAKVHLVRGEAAPAVRLARAQEHRARLAGWRREEVLSLEMQGDAAVLDGDVATARRCYGRSHDRARRDAPGGDLDAGLMRRLAQLTLLEGDLEAACSELRDAELMCQAAGEVFEQVVCARLLAEAHLELNAPAAARRAARRAVAAGRAHGCSLELARALLIEARAEAELVTSSGVRASRETAWSQASEARRLVRELGFEADCARCDRFLARLREDWRAAWVWAGGAPPPESLDGGVEPAFVARSPAMVQAAGQMAMAAAGNEPVLITGETGTGKEVAARRIHMLSGRRRGSLVTVNCAAVPRDLFEREFFGHAPGAFTGADQGARGLVEQANRGTLFLDEVGDLPGGLQAKLLRVLQDGTYRRVGDPAERRVDLRVIAATNIDLARRIEDGDFRRDLFFRLSVLEVWLPPLRDREGDVRALVHAFVRRGLGDGVDLGSLWTEAQLAAFERFGWPGNVRQLESLVRRACLYRRAGRELPMGLLSPELQELVETEEARRSSPSASTLATSTDEPDRFDLQARLQATERAVVCEALAAADGNRTRAASLLGVSRKSLYAKLTRLGLLDEPAGRHPSRSGLMAEDEEFGEV